MSKSIFDPFTGLLESFFGQNNDRLIELENELKEYVYAPVKPFYETNLSQKKASEILRECFNLAEAKFSEIAGEASIDRWLYILRRFPADYQKIDWETYLSLGLLRYSGWDIDSTFGKVSSGNQFGIVQAIPLEQLFDAFKLHRLANYLSYIAVAFRYAGKGAKLKPTQANPLNIEVPEDVRQAIYFYELRRPKKSIFGDQGFLVEFSTDKINYPLLILRKAPKMLRIWEPRQNIGLLAHYIHVTVDLEPLLKVLTVYDEPLKDIFGVSSKAIAHFLCAASTLTLLSFPKIVDFDPEKGFLLEPHDESYQYQHRLEFMFGVIQRGVLRFEYGHWVDRLSKVTSVWARNAADSELLIREFLDGFIIKSTDAEQRDKIDLSILNPIPLLFESPSREIYFDITLITDFLAWILECAKDWYSSHHGDMFTLSLKKYIETQTSARVIGWKRLFKTESKKAEVDLLVHSKSTLYSIECKAFGKSREYFRGDSQAISQRHSRIKKAVAQAHEAASVVESVLSDASENLPPVKNVKTVVCTPTQEYLKPLEVHGMLSDNIPLVCTPEEFIYFLSSGTK